MRPPESGWAMDSLLGWATGLERQLTVVAAYSSRTPKRTRRQARQARAPPRPIDGLTWRTCPSLVPRRASYFPNASRLLSARRFPAVVSRHRDDADGSALLQGPASQPLAVTEVGIEGATTGGTGASRSAPGK